MSKPILDLALEKDYPEFELRAELAVENGEFFSLLGPSGCGKTTLLRLIAGLERPDAGRITLNGRDITGLSPEKRRIGLVFQNYALFPHLNVYENIEYGLKLQRRSQVERKRRVGEMLALFRLETLAERTILQLSGGEQQRVALARALAVEPEVLLLDEPFAALDYEIRSRLRDELKHLQRSLGFTTIFVTHQQEEALSISDRIALMRQGRIIQSGRPRDVYENPVNRFAAEFLGDANLIPCRSAAADSEDCLIQLNDGRRLESAPEGSGHEAEKWLMVRPEDIVLNPQQPRLEGEIVRLEYLGHFYRLELDSGRFRIRAIAGKEVGTLKEGTRVGFGFNAEAVRVLEG
ncbi:MAG: ABC transporter ATP-binding protein [Firmicutes bacterium]|nr:ABC transporter ATP-binding protein [Bacillota bacterium]